MAVKQEQGTTEPDDKRIVTIGGCVLSNNDWTPRRMTRTQAKAYANKRMDDEMRAAGFEAYINAEEHNRGLKVIPAYQIHYTRPDTGPRYRRRRKRT